MIYNGKEIKKLGFGLMRLPTIDGEVDIEQSKQMVDTFIENGFTYFDTAYIYMNEKTEYAAKEVLFDRYPRESFQFATKLSGWIGQTAEEAQSMFFKSLERTGAGYFDFYLLHSINKARIKLYEERGLWKFILEQKQQGKIKNIGFSFHDSADILDELLTAHPEVDFLQLQINYADWEDLIVQSRKCYEVATKHNKPVIVMEPVRGGALATPPPQIQEIFDAADTQMPYAHWALGFPASLDNVMMVLSGMSTIEQMEQNVAFMKDFKKLSDEQQKVINHAQDVFKTIPNIPCTACQYCVKDCPEEIDIPTLLGVMNKILVYDDMNGATRTYNWATAKNGKFASSCIGCRTCEDRCPQSIKIADELTRIAEVFGK
ncbi:MAG: aldo/keto reductase [Clostridia bacterium]